MQPYDAAMVVVLIGATVFGFWKGMAWQVASLASLVLSYFVSLRFSASLAPHLSEHAPLNRFLAMLVLYMVTSLCVWLAFRVVAGFIDKIRLKDFDRQVGALFGAAKGVLLCAAITFFAVSLAPQARQGILTSKSGLAIARLIDEADAIMPPEIHQVLGPYLHKFEQQLDPNGTPMHPPQFNPGMQPIRQAVVPTGEQRAW